MIIPELRPSAKDFKSMYNAPSNIKNRSVKVVKRAATLLKDWILAKPKTEGPSIKPMKSKIRVSGTEYFSNTHSATYPNTIINDTKRRIKFVSILNYK